jgi:hypothetical protein
MDTEKTTDAALDLTNISVDANGNTVLKLTSPVKDGLETVDQLVIRRPIAADLRSMDDAKGGQAGMLKLISRLCVGQDEKVVASLDAYDYLQASAVATGFLTKPRPTGAKSSAT